MTDPAAIGRCSRARRPWSSASPTTSRSPGAAPRPSARFGRRSRDHLSATKRQSRYVEPLAKEVEASIFMPLDVQRRADRRRSSTRSRRSGASSTSAPLDRLLPRRRPAGPRHRLLEGRLPAGHGRVLLVVHPHGEARRAADEGRRHALHHDLLRLPDGGGELQHHGRRSRPRWKLPCATWPPSSDRKGIRVHAISPGPLKTRAASGITDFDELLAEGAGESAVRAASSRSTMSASPWPSSP